MADLRSRTSIKPQLDRLINLIEKLEGDPSTLSDAELVFVMEACLELSVRLGGVRLHEAYHKVASAIMDRPLVRDLYPEFDRPRGQALVQRQ